MCFFVWLEEEKEFNNSVSFFSKVYTFPFVFFYYGAQRNGAGDS